MKTKIKVIAAVFSAACMIVFLNQCQSPAPVETPDATLTKILKDLDSSTYSLNFPSNLGLKTEYGALNDFTMVQGDALGFNPQDTMTEGNTKTKQIRYIIPRRIPKFVLPVRTCPTMIPFPLRDKLTDIFTKVKFNAGKAVEVDNSNVIFATDQATKYFSNLKADRIDKEGFVGVDADKVLVLFENMPNGATREFYGNADATKFTAATGVREVQDRQLMRGPRIGILPPHYIGCFDILNLKRLQQNLLKINPQVNYQVIQGNTGFATIGAR